jgi:nucleotide-binding universal stress UspA family protein
MAQQVVRDPKGSVGNHMGDKLRRVLVPVSGGPSDERLLESLSSICQIAKPQFTLVYVVEVPQAMPIDAELPGEIARGEAVLERAEIYLKKRIGEKFNGVLTELLQARTAGAAIVDEATEQNADMVMLATDARIKHGKTTLGDSVAYVLKNCPCEVFLIRTALDLDEEE